MLMGKATFESYLSGRNTLLRTGEDIMVGLILLIFCKEICLFDKI